jgi:hypothetical protein
MPRSTAPELTAHAALPESGAHPAGADAPAADVPGEPEAVIDLLETTLRLIDVLEGEIEMLRAMDPAEMQALQQDKIVLAAAYESQLRRLSEQPELAGPLSQELRAELKEATDAFQEVLATNERALRAAKTATNGVLQAVVDAANRQDPRASYSPRGRHARRNPRAPHAVSINERL